MATRWSREDKTSDDKIHINGNSMSGNDHGKEIATSGLVSSGVESLAQQLQQTNLREDSVKDEDAPASAGVSQAPGDGAKTTTIAVPAATISYDRQRISKLPEPSRRPRRQSELTHSSPPLELASRLPQTPSILKPPNQRPPTQSPLRQASRLPQTSSSFEPASQLQKPVPPPVRPFPTEKFETKQLCLSTLKETIFSSGTRFLFRVQHEKSHTEYRSSDEFAYIASYFTSPKHPVPPRTVKSKIADVIVSVPLAEWAFEHAKSDARSPSPFISTTDDLLRAFSIAARDGDDTTRISIVNPGVLDDIGIKCFSLEEVLSYVGSTMGTKVNIQPQTHRDPEKRKALYVEFMERRKSRPRPSITDEEYILREEALKRNEMIKELAPKTATEFIIWQCIPRSAIIVEWDWKDLKKSPLLEKYVPELLGGAWLKRFRHRIDLRNTGTQITIPEDVLLKHLIGNSAFHLSIDDVKSREFEFLLFFAVKIAGFHMGYGTLNMDRSGWPSPLDHQVFNKLMIQVGVEYKRRGREFFSNGELCIFD